MDKIENDGSFGIKEFQIDINEYKTMVAAFKEIGAVFYFPGCKPEFTFFNKNMNKMDGKEFSARKRQYPLTPEEAWLPQPEPMFPVFKLREAYDYYVEYSQGVQSARGFFEWLNTLVKDIPFDQQRYQP